MRKDLSTPVLFLIFNRPDTTQQVFNAIRNARPPRLYIAADGPRDQRPEDRELCTSARSVTNQVDWPCDVQTLLREQNLGCRIAISSALDWFFQREEEGVILEDDCFPDPSFFLFCQELLSHYRDDHRIMHISGDNFQQGRVRGTGSYYFSRYSHVWGWASWRRAWKFYDVTMSSFPRFAQEGGMRSIFRSSQERRYWQRKFSLARRGTIDTWDYQWAYAIWTHHGLSIIPNVNLVANIGVGAGATHTAGAHRGTLASGVGSIGNLTHPLFLLPDEVADRFTFHRHFLGPLSARIRRTIMKVLR